MMQPNDRPIRVIYAKLTSTGAYDVVAHTRGVPLDHARTLAEQLLPGNPPMDSPFEELIGSLRMPDGSRTILRFARYPWKDGDRGDVYSTDIVQVSDATFDAARCNAFALVPRSDDVFDVLTELDDVSFPATTAASEHARIRQLNAGRDTARSAIANMLAADRVLLGQPGDRAAIVELFTLLLPPRLRPQLTFLTGAFRVPSLLPRVTLVERASANLRDASWTVLPSPDVDVPMELAGRLLALADDAATLELTHALYDDAFARDEASSLRAGVTRLMRCAALAGALRNGAVEQSLAALADPGLDAPLAAAGLRRLAAQTDAIVIEHALVALLQQGGESTRRLQQLLGRMKLESRTTGVLIDALPAGTPADLTLELAAQAAAAGDAARVIQLLGRDRRAMSAHLESRPARLPDDLLRMIAALRRAAAPPYDIDAAADVLREAHSLAGAFSDARTADTLRAICRSTIEDVLRQPAPHLRNVSAMRGLIDAPGADAVVPSDASAVDRFVADTGAAAAALGAAALMDRALDAHAAGDAAHAEADVAIATALLERSGHIGRDLVRHLLVDRSVSESDLVTMPSADVLLPLLGGSAAHAMTARRLVDAIAAAAAREDGVQLLAGAVYAAHTQQLRITPGTELSQRVLDALRSFAESQERSSPAAELCLELLSVITPPAHMAELEDAALGAHMTVRLRRLDRSIAICRAAEDERRYDLLADAIESNRNGVDVDARARLRAALGTGGMSRRLMRLVASVVDKEGR